MATFNNQAQLSYNGMTIDTNLVAGEIIPNLEVTKQALTSTYTLGSVITYVVTLKNSSSTDYTDLTLSDNLGSFAFNALTLVPLTYVINSISYILDGELQTSPVVDSSIGELAIEGFDVPAGSTVTFIYDALVNECADVQEGGTIVNTVTVSGTQLATPIEVCETIDAVSTPILTIVKTACPSYVLQGETVTYSFVIKNTGYSAADASANIVLSDTLTPPLANLVATNNGVTWTITTDYTYNALSGEFASIAGKITVPGATITQNSSTGIFEIVPGIATVKLSGTIN